MRFTIRVNVPEMPPGHAAVPAASVPSKRRVQNRFPVSLSTAKTWLEGAPIIESGVKMFTPDVITPAPSETPCRTGLSSVVFHCSSNPSAAGSWSRVRCSRRSGSTTCAAHRRMRSATPRVAASLTPDDAGRGDGGGQCDGPGVPRHHRPTHFPAAAGTPKLYIVPSNVPRYARPLATVRPLKWFQDVI